MHHDLGDAVGDSTQQSGEILIDARRGHQGDAGEGYSPHSPMGVGRRDGLQQLRREERARLAEQRSAAFHRMTHVSDAVAFRAFRHDFEHAGQTVRVTVRVDVSDAQLERLEQLVRVLELRIKLGAHVRRIDATGDRAKEKPRQ
jgi:hypothetical protein